MFSQINTASRNEDLANEYRLFNFCNGAFHVESGNCLWWLRQYHFCKPTLTNKLAACEKHLSITEKRAKRNLSPNFSNKSISYKVEIQPRGTSGYAGNIWLHSTERLNFFPTMDNRARIPISPLTNCYPSSEIPSKIRMMWIKAN